MIVAGYTRRNSCRACCNAQHDEWEESCDECPFIEAGVEGQEVLRIFNLATEQYTDPKSKVKTTSISPERVMMAFSIYDVTEKQKAFSYLARAVNIMNGEE